MVHVLNLKTKTLSVVFEPLIHESQDEYVARCGAVCTCNSRRVNAKGIQLCDPTCEKNVARDAWRSGWCCVYCGTQTNRALKVCSSIECENKYELAHHLHLGFLAKRRDQRAETLKKSGAFSVAVSGDNVVLTEAQKIQAHYDNLGL